MGSTGGQGASPSLKCGVIGGNVRDGCHVSEAEELGAGPL